MDDQKPKVAIILPVNNSMPHLKPMIDALYESTNFPFELIIIESESTDGTTEYITKLSNEKKNITIHFGKKEGLTKAINKGINLAGGLDVYITQDDVIHFKLYGRDWLAEMWENAQKPEKGIVTCLNGGGISDSDYIEGLRWVGTWAMYLPRKTIKKVGLFDENMCPGDDVDYCYRIGEAGLGGIMIDYWVQHHRLTEHGTVDDEKRQKKMSKYFKKKWGIK